MSALCLSGPKRQRRCGAGPAHRSALGAGACRSRCPGSPGKPACFKKYDLDFNLVFIPSSPVATAATISGDAEIGVTGAVGNVRAIVQGTNDLVFIGGMKNFLTHSIMGKADIKSPQDLKGKKVARRPLRRQYALFCHPGAQDASAWTRAKDIQTIQTGGGPETVASLLGGNVDAAGLVAPGDFSGRLARLSLRRQRL